MLLYPAVFTPDTDSSSIAVAFPDIPEALTFGTDIEHAYQMAEEVLGFALEDYKDYPKASNIATIQAEHPGSTIALVSIDMTAYMRKYHSKKIRKNVNIPEWLNELAEAQKINFSQVLTEALELKLEV